MRLTLRNLLRFLDRTDLDPMERAQLEELVNKSDRAAAWIHRIKSLRSDPRKSAAVAMGSSSIGDVARYVDGIMTEQEAVEFEKTMLVSDHLLAEVASVHWMVHQKRPPTSSHISLVLRQTLYDIDRVYATSAEKVARGGDETAGSIVPTSMTDLPFEDASDAANDPATDSILSTVDGRSQPLTTQPPVSLEQMKQRSNNRSWMAVAIVIGTLVGTTSLSFWLGQKTANRRPAAVYNDSPVADNKPDDGSKPVVNNPEPDPEKGTSENPENEVVKPVAVDPAPLVIANHPQPPEHIVVTENAEDSSEKNLPRRPDIRWSLYTPVPPEMFIGPIQPPRVVASSSSRQPTALFKTNDSNWAVVDAQSQLLETDKVLVLSGGQATFQMGEALTLTVDGPALLAFGDFDRASGSELVVLEFGRIQVSTKLGFVDWSLQIDAELHRISMIDAQSVVEVQVHDYFPPGTDPRESTAVQTRVIRSIAGRSKLQLAEAIWMLDMGTAMIQSHSELPEWAVPVQHGVFEPDAGTVRYVDRVGEIVVQETRKWVESQADIPAELISLKNDSRQEMRLAAMTWLAELGQFEFVVDYFGNEDNKSNWRTFLQAIRLTIQSEPAYAERLFEGLALAGLADQPRWYKLILGYSPDELEKGADANLVEMLSDASLGIRALAIENLREITGGITYGYLPTRNTTDRNRTIKRQWVPMLEKKAIRYATPPAPILPRVTVAPVMPDPAGSGAVEKENSGSR